MNLNCILLGDCNVGKSHLLSHFKYHTSDLCVYVPTIGVDFHVYKKILRIWDTSETNVFIHITTILFIPVIFVLYVVIIMRHL